MGSTLVIAMKLGLNIYRMQQEKYG